jgi:phosphatidylglycerophosphatase C
MKDKPALVLFDFDGTMTTKDSFRTFLENSCGSRFEFFIKYYLYCAVSLLKLRLGASTVREMKERRATVFLANLDPSCLEELSQRFSTNEIPRILRPEAEQRLKWHKERGDDVYLVSASFDFCLASWAKKMSVGLLTNSMDWNKGRMTAPDCNYEEKPERIGQAVELSDYNSIYAYGYTAGDRPMLALATHPYYRYFHTGQNENDE